MPPVITTRLPASPFIVVLPRSSVSLYPTPCAHAPGRQPFIAVVSDTHGYYDQQLDELFAGAAHIVHAGDVGASGVHRRVCGALAPLTVVAGNTDLPGALDAELPWEADVTVAGQADHRLPHRRAA